MGVYPQLHDLLTLLNNKQKKARQFRALISNKYLLSYDLYRLRITKLPIEYPAPNEQITPTSFFFKSL